MSNSLWHRTCLVVGGAFLVLAIDAQAADGTDLSAAKQEGKVVWYTSTPIATANKIAKLFETKTGLKVDMFRSGGSALVGRFQREISTAIIAVDVLTTSDPAAVAAMARQGAFEPFKPAGFEQVPDVAKDDDGAYVAQRLNVMTLFVRTDKLKASDVPRTWAALTDPKYKGMMVMANPSFTALQLMEVATLSKKLGWDYYEKLQKNDVMIVEGNEEVVAALKSGQRVIAVGANDVYAKNARQDGYPIASIYPTEGVFLIPSPTAVVKGSPHPNAAKLFAEFTLSEEAQKLLTQDGGYAARMDIPPPSGSPELGSMKALRVDYGQVDKEEASIKRRFNEIFSGSTTGSRPQL
ncbi:MAG: iron(III) transport system substrate-binding protein [Alphaproteobacteria bacterium]|jgi:iron(III) transport system substrate-binding protein|nr:iron(III) transport system substrate-binding protein [Alphaproteobacteria bacterium]MEA2992460.1 iron(III) transport system substrate-binding protein [Alphaproteobacteria bacterium]